MSDAMRIPLFSEKGEPAGTLQAPDSLAGRPNAHAVYLAVLRQLANARTGTSSTKTRGEVSGGGRKPWKQKHTGRARQGSIRSPQWRHGAVIFGPRPRLYKKDLPAQVRTLAFRSVLSEKVRTGKVAVIAKVILDGWKTKNASALLGKLSCGSGTLLVLKDADAKVRVAFRNIPGVRVDTVIGVSAYDLLKSRNIVVAQDALEPLGKRCGG